MTRPDIALTESEVSEFLDNGRNLQVATLGRDGYPHLTALWYVVVDGLIAFRSFRKSQRVANLRSDPRLTVLMEDGDSVVNLRGVKIQGRARLVDDRDLALHLYGEVTEKYEGMRVEPEGWDAVFGVWADKNMAILVEPDRIATWDHTKWVRQGKIAATKGRAITPIVLARRAGHRLRVYVSISHPVRLPSHV